MTSTRAPAASILAHAAAWLALLAVAPASACSLSYRLNPDWEAIEAEEFRDADQVLVLRLDRLDPKAMGRVDQPAARFAVLRRFKGDATGGIDVHVFMETSCSPGLTVGHHYVAYLDRDEAGRLWISDDSFPVAPDAPVDAEPMLKLQQLSDKQRSHPSP